MTVEARSDSPSASPALDSQDEASAPVKTHGLRDRMSSLARSWHRKNTNTESSVPKVDKELHSKLALRVTIQQARYLAIEGEKKAKPYCIVGFAGLNERTHAATDNVNPDWSTSFDFGLFSQSRQSQTMLWSESVSADLYFKANFRSTLVGQCQWPLEQLFENTPIAYDDKANTAKWYSLTKPNKSRRLGLKHRDNPEEKDLGSAKPEVQIKFGLVLLGEEAPVEHVEQAWASVIASAHDDSGSITPEVENLMIADTGKEDSTLSPLSKPSISALEPKRQESRRSFGKKPKKQVVQLQSGLVGITFLEISHANNLPPEKNVTHTGFDMDPFVIVSFGTSTYRTDHVRHCLDPVWNEQIQFSVHETERNYKLKFSVYDKDKFSSNDFVASQEVSILDIIERSKDTEIASEAIDADMEYHTIPLVLANKDKWEGKINPTLTFRTKFISYVQIRKMFWHALAKTYDVDDTGKLGRMEVQMMLESLGSTVTDDSVDKFWHKSGKDPAVEGDELLIDELAQSLEEFLLTAEENQSPSVTTNDITEKEGSPADKSDTLTGRVQRDGAYQFEDESSQSSSETTTSSLSEDESVLQDANKVQYIAHGSSSAKLGSFRDGDAEAGEDDEVLEEKLIRFTDCPVCHCHFSKSKYSQLDIVTHVATCSMHDWTQVDRIVMGNAVTEAYAQRKWFVKLISKVGYGGYSIGKNNANIIVQDRITGQLIEERMSVYVRLGMRLIYRGMKTSTHSKTAKRILTSMTFKQGVRYDSPYSLRYVEPFITFHGLNMDEVLEPIENFKSFNEFFYRKLKAEARPCEEPDNPCTIVSPSDCRMMAFQTVDEATRMWIKGSEFSLGKLLHDDTNRDFDGGSLAIFRLAPQDYHRFHFPVDGVITSIQHYEGQYYTVNPIAIRTKLDVYGDNAKTIVQIDSDAFGKVVMVCIGAMMVGSIVITATEGEHKKRTEELGYFKFGGSTVVVLWQKDTILFDEDLRDNAEKPLETLVRVGNKIGRRTS